MHGYTIFCWLYAYLLVRELVNNYKDKFIDDKQWVYISKINNNIIMIFMMTIKF